MAWQILLETYTQEVSRVRRSLGQLQTEMESTESNMALRMDDARNKLLTFDVVGRINDCCHTRLTPPSWSPSFRCRSASCRPCRATLVRACVHAYHVVPS